VPWDPTPTPVAPTVDFTGPAVDVARDLLGAVLRLGGVAVRLTETEAYEGTGDPAAHAARGLTPATAALFGPPGSLYCFFSYGVHVCGNLVTGPPGRGSAVLLRAGDIVDGVGLARRRRWGPAGETVPTRPDAWLAKGPGNLGRALGLTLAHAGQRVGRDFQITAPPRPPAIRSGPRVGVSVAHERPWRFWIDGDASVSAYKRSPRAVPGSW